MVELSELVNYLLASFNEMIFHNYHEEEISMKIIKLRNSFNDDIS